MSRLLQIARRLAVRHNKRRIPALFLHIQKTAGSSLLAVVRRHYGTSVTSHGDCWGHAPDEFESVDFVSGHFGYDYAKHLMAGRFSFTFLRDPVERVLSMYYFCKERNPAEFEIYRRANRLDLIEFLDAAHDDPWIKKNIWNNQVWQLAHGYAHLDDRTIDDFNEDDLLAMAKSHLLKFDRVGFTETLDQDARSIFASLGIPLDMSIPKVNDTRGRPIAMEVSSRAISLISDLTRLDRSLYEYALQIYKPVRASRE